MGGGGPRAMRTAAKVASAGLRGMPLAPPAEQSVRKSSRPVSAVVSSQAANPVEVAALHTAASWEMDDFADDGLVMDAGEPTPRLVFSGVPSFHAAKDAMSELKDAIDKGYLSSNSSNCGSSAGSQVSVLSPAHRESETKSCVIETTSAPLVVSNRALQAFKLLSGSLEAQTVVASIASDPNVWNAVMENSLLKDFIQAQQKEKYAAVAGFKAEESPNLEEVFDSVSVDMSGNQKPGFDFFGLLQNFRLKVAVVFSGMSTYLQNKFGFAGPDKTYSGDNGNTKELFADEMVLRRTFSGMTTYLQNKFGFAGADKTSGDDGNTKEFFADEMDRRRTIIGLVVMVILMILLKQV